MEVYSRLKTRFLFATLVLFSHVVDASEFTFYTYHDKPPYYFSTQTRALAAQPGAALPQSIGLYQALIDQINKRQKQWHINLQYMPRKRVDLLLQSDRLSGALIGVNPAWFKDRQRQRYHWSKPFLWDTDIIATATGRALEYKHPDDLIGLNLALPRGYYFWGVTENLKADLQQAMQTSSELQNLKLLAVGRADATILSAMTLHYYENTVFQPRMFEALATPHDRYFRAILFPRTHSSVFSELESTIIEVVNSAEWQAILQSARGNSLLP